jgi:serine/threonine protein kinase
MLDSRGHVKLVDFGLCCELKGPDERVSPTGSLIYMAPEMIRDHRGGRHTDW